MEVAIIILAAAVVVLLYLFLTLRMKDEALKNDIQTIAQEQFQKWRDKECESIRLQQLEIARREANTSLEQWKYQSELSIRSDAIQRSQNVIVGNVTQHIVPYLPQFKFNPKDVRFLGSPIDLIVFDGLSDGEVQSVVFIEIKTGTKSRLTKRQQDVKDAVVKKRVKWLEMRINHKD